MRWAVNVECMGQMRNSYHLEYLDVDGKKILELIIQKEDAGLDSSGSG